jgi:hypothetical protein
MLDAVQVALRIDATVSERQRTVTDADRVDLPDDRRPTFRPLLEQTRFARDAIALGATPLGPIFGGEVGGGGERSHCEYGSEGLLQE